MKRTSISLAILSAIYGIPTIAEESSNSDNRTVMDEVSVTATRIERATKNVPEAINVISKERIESEQMFNIKDAIRGTPGVLIESKSNSYSTRLIIRGAGQKARYGVREIMVLRDGVPMTDPDSFSRFDYIDTQDIESIEITKGPGSLYGSGSAGGTIQILSKSVLENDENRFKIGAGQEGQKNIHFRRHLDLDENQSIAITGSHRETDNSWRDWNKFDSQQISLKHGFLLSDGSTLESEIAYTKADLQLPASMTAAEFANFERTGEQHNTSSAWQNSGRYSTILFINSQLEKELDDFTIKPRFYYNRWDHYHPVTGAINDNPGTDVIGADLEFVKEHQLWGESTLVAGITARTDITDNSKKYKYGDVTSTGTVDPDGFGPQTPIDVIDYTNSDTKGDLLSTEEATNTLYGLFIQESMNPTDNIVVDAGFRYDRMNFDITETRKGEFSWEHEGYIDYAADDVIAVDKTFNLFSPKIGISYSLSDVYSIYASASRGGQLPSESELQSAKEDDIDLKEAISNSLEAGIKARSSDWSLDLSIYKNRVDDDIIQVRKSLYSMVYQNAATTDKRGVEINGSVSLNESFALDLSYAYSDYTFRKFIEAVRASNGQITNYDRSGNHIPYIPQNQYSIGLGYKHPTGFSARVQSDTWGSYYTDNDNSETYEGYKFLTSMMLGYTKGQHTFSMNVNNLFDKQYAAEVKGTGTDKSFSAGAPRSALLTYNYDF